MMDVSSAAASTRMRKKSESCIDAKNREVLVAPILCNSVVGEVLLTNELLLLACARRPPC